MFLLAEMTTVEVIHSIMLTLMSIILLRAIPWAMCIGKKITRVETKISNGISARLDNHESRIREIETEG